MQSTQYGAYDTPAAGEIAALQLSRFAASLHQYVRYERDRFYDDCPMGRTR